MKRRLIRHILLTATGILLAACSAVEESAETLAPARQEPQPVAFSAYVNRGTTRGGATGTLTIDGTDATTSLQTEGFGVFAYYTDSHLYNQLSLPNFMYNQQVLYNTTASQWTYSPVKYWPNETGATGTYDTDRLTFFAYAPYTAVDAIGHATTNTATGIVALSRPKDSGDPIVRYYAALKPTDAVDLCWGIPQTGSNIDVTKPALDSKVSFNFKHALAALNVQIDATIDDGTPDVDATTRVWVRSITFEGFTLKGQLNLNNETSTPHWNSLDCDCDLTADPVTIYDGRRDRREGVAATLNEGPTGLNPAIVQSAAYGSVGLTDGVKKTAVNLFDISEWPNADSPTAAEIAARLAAPVFVIPTADPMRVTIVYDVETQDPKLVSQYLADGKTHGSSIRNEISADIKNGSSEPITMAAGTRYTISLHLGLTSVKVDASVSPWPTTAAETINLP